MKCTDCGKGTMRRVTAWGINFDGDSEIIYTIKTSPGMNKQLVMQACDKCGKVRFTCPDSSNRR